MKTRVWVKIPSKQELDIVVETDPNEIVGEYLDRVDKLIKAKVAQWIEENAEIGISRLYLEEAEDYD